MQRDRLVANPQLARLILTAGAALHFFLCGPLYGRRGYPEVEPFWLAMIWLWIPPVIVSAVFIPWNRQRARHLFIYSLVAGFIVSWGTVTLVPSRKHPIEAILEMTLFWPLVTAGITLVECLSRAVLRPLRQFVPEEAVCESCGYSLFGLRDPRCPECGTAFDVCLLDPAYVPYTTPTPHRWSTWLIAIVLIASALWPPCWSEWAEGRAVRDARREAEADWAAGTITWYMTREEESDRYQKGEEPRTGNDWQLSGKRLRISGIWNDWRDHTSAVAYREVIQRKWREAGLPPPAFMPTTTQKSTEPAP